MKPVQATIKNTIVSGNIFSIGEINQAHFGSEFHFHKECQLAYIAKGTGKRIVGDSIGNFDDGELVFIGSDIPHVWYNAHSRITDSTSHSISLFISPDDLLHHLAALGDVQKTRELLVRAGRGMLITGKSRNLLIGLLKKAMNQHGLRQILTLLKIVHLLTITAEFTLLTSNAYVNLFQFRDNERMNRVYQFLLGNFRKEILLKDIAGIAGMNPQAFCRFFKSRTQKSFTQFVNEIRVGHACKLLGERSESITQIAYECGFNNVSNFNRFFKEIKKVSPRLYRKEMELHYYA